MQSKRFLAAIFSLLPLVAQDGEFVFRSDVSLVRVDAQVLDRGNRAVMELRAEDFVLRESGRPLEIKNFAREEMPIDILFLLDVSGSMQPHVERVALAAQDALNSLGPNDRVAIMVFDRATRLRMPFKQSRQEIRRGLDGVLRQESFDGGTDVTRGLTDAANYVNREGRREARRAIVILTDDQTERDRDENGVARALGDTVLSALIAPDAIGSRGRIGSGGGGMPQDPLGGVLGGIIFGRSGSRGGIPGAGSRRSRTQSAGSAEIARRSGGDSFQVDEASALERTLTRLRQRYALHFLLPEGVKPGQENIEVELASAARRRYPDAEVRYRRTQQPGGEAIESRSAPTVVRAETREENTGLRRRRPASNDGERAQGPIDNGGWRKADEPERPAAAREPQVPNEPAVKPAEPRPASGGWRRVKPGEEP